MPQDSLRFSLLDERTKERYRFTLAELKAFVKVTPQSRLASIRVQVEGRAEWQSLEKFHLAQEPRELEIAPEEETTVIELRQNIVELKPRRESKSKVEATSNQERRRSPRVQIRRRTIIVSGNLVYRTFTVDASVDGLRLEHPIPKELHGQVVDCYLSSQDLLTGIFFRAVLVEGGNNSVRMRFVEQDAKNTAILGRWLANLQKQSA